ncbi:MAG: hypothetical protein AAGA65_09080 [Actinomycetota bacterium]
MPTKAQLQERLKELEAELEGRWGPVRRAVAAALPEQSERLPWIDAKAQVLLALAEQIDGMRAAAPSDYKGPPPNVAAMAKELRAGLDALEAEIGNGQEPGFFDGLGLPTPVGDPPAS